MFVSNGLIRFETSSNHPSLLDGLPFAFWVDFPIRPANLKREGFGIYECIPYETNWVFISHDDANSNLPEWGALICSIRKKSIAISLKIQYDKCE